MNFVTAISSYLNEEGNSSESALSGMPDFIQNATSFLLPLKYPHWKAVELNIIPYNPATVSGNFYEFITFKNNTLGIIFAWPNNKEAEGLLLSVSFQGMIRALAFHFHSFQEENTSQAQDFLSDLNQLLMQHFPSELFTVSLLLLHPTLDQLQYITCGKGVLWLIPNEANQLRKLEALNPFLGSSRTTDFFEATHNWNIGDSLVLIAYSEEKKIEDKYFEQAINDVLLIPPKRQPELILHKLNLQTTSKNKDRILTLMSLQRKG